MRLTNEQKDAARRLLALTETKQFALSSLSGLSPSVISEMTNLNRDRDIQTDTWRKFVAGLERIVGDFKKAKSSEPHLHAEVDRLFGDALQREEKAILAEKGSFLQDPGGWIDSNAANYVTRQIDRAFERYLDRNTGAMVTVAGPIQSGRSSAVRRLADRAAALGFGADLVDLLDMPDLRSDSGWTADRLVRWVLEQLEIETPKGSFGKQDFAAEASQALLRGLEVRTLRVGRAFLILDSFDSLARTAAELGEEDLLSRWIIAMRNALAVQSPFERMTMVVVSNAPAWPMDGVMSSTISQGRVIKAGKFTDEEVGALFKACDLDGDEFREARGYALADLDGQPFLTHAVAAELTFGATMRDVRAMAAALEGDFGRHWRQLFRTVSRHFRDRSPPDVHATTLLHNAVDLADNKGGSDMSAADLRFLRASGVLDGSEVPQMCTFYQQAIAKLPK